MSSNWMKFILYFQCNLEHKGSPRYKRTVMIRNVFWYRVTSVIRLNASVKCKETALYNGVSWGKSLGNLLLRTQQSFLDSLTYLPLIDVLVRCRCNIMSKLRLSLCLDFLRRLLLQPSVRKKVLYFVFERDMNLNFMT